MDDAMRRPQSEWRPSAIPAGATDSDVIVGVSSTSGPDKEQQLKRIAFVEPPPSTGSSKPNSSLRYSRLLQRVAPRSDQGGAAANGVQPTAPDAPPRASYSSTAAPAKPALKSSSYQDLVPLGAPEIDDDFPHLQPSPREGSRGTSGSRPPLLPPPPPPATASAPGTFGGHGSSTAFGAGVWGVGGTAVGGARSAAQPSSSSIAADSSVDLAARWRAQQAKQQHRQPEVAMGTMPPGTISLDKLDKDDPLGAAAAALGAALARRNSAQALTANGYAAKPLAAHAPDADDATAVVVHDMEKGLPSDGDGASGIASPKGGGTSMVFGGVDDAAEQLPPLREQLSLRALLVGVVVGGCLALLCVRLALVVGASPSFQVLAAAGCWLLLRGFTYLLGRDIEALAHPLIAQEAAVAAAAALACAGSVAAAGFANVIMGLDPSTATTVGASWPGNSGAGSYSQVFWRNMLYMFLTTLAGGILMLALRKPLMGRRRAVYPTGEATGALLGALLPGEATTPAAAYQRALVNRRLGRWTAASFAFSLWQWFFNRPGCNGFRSFPTFGLAALRYTWAFDFQLPFVGVGMMVPAATAWSMLLGGVLSWGVLIPILADKRGQWYPTGLPDWDFRGVGGYRLMIATTLLVVDAAYTLVRIAVSAAKQRMLNSRAKRAAAAGRAFAAGGLASPRGTQRVGSDTFGDAVASPTAAEAAGSPTAAVGGAPGGVMAKMDAMWRAQKQPLRKEGEVLSDDSAGAYLLTVATMDRVLRRHVFMADRTPWWLAAVGYVVILGACTGVLPVLYSQVPWYMIMLACALAVLGGVANAKGTGETDINLSYVAYASVGSLLFASWSGNATAGLVAGGVVGAVAYGSAQAMYAFRAGHAVLANPLAIFLAQLLGAVVGCLIAPAALLMYAKQDPLGGATFPAPEAVVWRKNAATAAAGGIGQLPDYTWAFALGAAALSLVLCVLRDIVPARVRPILPAPSSMGITFLSGANIAVDLCVGALVRLLWGLRHPDSAQVHAGVVGAGLIIGDGLWLLGRGLLAAFNVLAPVCMIFQ